MLCVSLTLLSWRLVDLQVLRHPELKDRAADNTRSVATFKPGRGDIRDSRGAVLATSIPVRRVVADPTLMGTNQVLVARAIAPVLGLDAVELERRFQPQILRYATNGKPVYRAYLPVKEKVSLDDWEKVRSAMAAIEFGPNSAAKRGDRWKEELRRRAVRNASIFSEQDHLRVYPNGHLASHLIGFLAVQEQETPEGTIKEEYGVDGVERLMDSDLKGIRGVRESEVDKRGTEVAMFRKQNVATEPGWNVVMTLDLGLQHIVETELTNAYAMHSPVSASCVVLRPSTGDILAMANIPGFDANRPGDYPVANRKNRVIAEYVEPGSTYKCLVIAAALNEGLFSLRDQIHCGNGSFEYQKRRLTDGGHHYGMLSVEEVLAKSSNIGAAKIGIALGPERLWRYSKGFGIGTHPGTKLFGEGAGLLNPLSSWNGFSITSVPMGHEVAVTQLQMALAIGALANKGILMRPRLIARIEDNTGKPIFESLVQPVRKVVSPAAATLAVQAMKKVVSPIGTGKSIVMEHYSAAGKTGTAQKPKAGIGGTYSMELYVSSFIGFFPADNPQLLISVMLDEPKGVHTGAGTAAPVFKAIAERAANYLNIAPDLTPAVPAVTRSSGEGLERSNEPLAVGGKLAMGATRKDVR